MKLLNFESIKNKKIKKKKIIVATILLIIIVLIILLYFFNSFFRNIIDKYILRKEILQNNTVSIDYNPDDNEFAYAYDKYITVLSKNKISSYTNSGSKVSEIEVQINNPLFASNGRFLCIAEKNGNIVYLISGSNIIWYNNIDGQITQINVNKNGYVSVVISGTSYKNIIVTFDSTGKELFKTFLSSTIAIDTDISNDNKFLAVAEVDTSRYSSGIICKNNIYN